MNLILKVLSIENIPEVKILTKMQPLWMNHLLLTFYVACIEMDVSCSNPQKIASSIWTRKLESLEFFWTNLNSTFPLKLRYLR